MGRAVRFVVLLFGGVALGAVVFGAPRALSRLEGFRVQDYALEGASFLTEDEAIRWAAVPEGASIWDDPTPWEEGLAGHPLVEAVDVDRDLPHTVVFHVREKRPVALVPRPTLEPVDGRGESLPLDPAIHRLDLPVIRPRVEGAERGLSDEELGDVVEELDRLASADPSFLATVSDVAVGDRGEIVAALTNPAVRLVFQPPLTPLRLRDGLQAAADARGRSEAGGVRRVDLRFDDLVVVELEGRLTSRTTD